MSDRRLRDDLAVVGRVSRTRGANLDATLRAVGAVSTGDVAAAAISSRAVTRADVVLVSASRIYAARVARIVTGIAIVLLYGARMFDTLVPNFLVGWRADLGYAVFYKYLPRLNFIALFALIYVVASVLAGRVFRRRLLASTSPVEYARRAVDAVDRWSLTLAIAGGSTFLALQFLTIAGLDASDLLWIQADVSGNSPGFDVVDALLMGGPIFGAVVVWWGGAVVVARKLPTVSPRIALALSVVVLALGKYKGTPDHDTLGAGIVYAITTLLIGAIVAILAVDRRTREHALLEEAV